MDRRISGRVAGHPTPISVRAKAFAGASSILILAASVWEGFRAVLDGTIGTFSAELAILTVGAITAVWGGTVAFETLRHSLGAEERRLRVVRKGLSSAVLAELYIVHLDLVRFVKGPDGVKGPKLMTDVFRTAVERVDLFPHDAARELARTNGVLSRYRTDRSSVMAAALLHQLSHLASALVAAGGERPRTFREKEVSAEELLASLPDFPKGEADLVFIKNAEENHQME